MNSYLRLSYSSSRRLWCRNQILCPPVRLLQIYPVDLPRSSPTWHANFSDITPTISTVGDNASVALSILTNIRDLRIEGSHVIIGGLPHTQWCVPLHVRLTIPSLHCCVDGKWEHAPVWISLRNSSNPYTCRKWELPRRETSEVVVTIFVGAAPREVLTNIRDTVWAQSRPGINCRRCIRPPSQDLSTFPIPPRYLSLLDGSRIRAP